MTTGLILVGIIITALTPTIAIIVTRILDQSERQVVAQKTAEVAVKADAAAATVADVADKVETRWLTTSEKLDEIHVLVDGRMSEAVEKMEKQGLVIDALNVRLEEMKEGSRSELEEVSRLRHEARSHAAALQLIKDQLEIAQSQRAPAGLGAGPELPPGTSPTAVVVLAQPSPAELAQQRIEQLEKRLGLAPGAPIPETD